jgi:hypothetical protein
MIFHGVTEMRGVSVIALSLMAAMLPALDKRNDTV